MRIYIYSRKSKWTGRGDSVENQLAMCREYIQYNISGSSEAQIEEYEDEGYSGKNTHRPQFQKMMCDIKADHCDYLVCYKLDRLGRNVADLANFIEFLNKEDVSFISIKERFDTSTPIGKAMLYFAGVLAQMEREQIAERVRDNMIMLARKGRWLGGNTPLGFLAKEEEKMAMGAKSKKTYRLTVNKDEIYLVEFMFQNYLENQSLMGIVRCFQDKGILTKRGRPYTTTAIRNILTNPVYCVADEDAYAYFTDQGCQVCLDKKEADGCRGLMSYGKTSSREYKSKENELDKWIISLGRHKGIVSGRDFVKIQRLLLANRHKGSIHHKAGQTSALLSGLLYCSCGHRMRPKNYTSSQVAEDGGRRFSYLCPYKDVTHGEKCSVRNVQGNTLDRLVCGEVLQYTQENLSICNVLQSAESNIDYSYHAKVTDGDIIHREILKKREETRNLIAAIGKFGKDEEFARQAACEIAKANEECAVLEAKLSEAGTEKIHIEREKEQFIFAGEQISSFHNLFDTLSTAEKREYLGMILDRVVWDGERAHLFLYGSA